MSVKSSGRLSTRVRFISATPFKLTNDIGGRQVEEWYNCITMERLDNNRELRAFVRIGTEFQQAIAEIESEHGRGYEFDLYCQVPDGQKANNHLVDREHDNIKYIKVNYCSLQPFKGKSQREIDAAKKARKQARFNTLLGK